MEIGNLPLAVSEVIDARDRFRPFNVVYKVQINVEVNARFLWAVMQCLFTRKKLLINHTFTNNPLLPED